MKKITDVTGFKDGLRKRCTGCAIANLRSDTFKAVNIDIRVSVSESLIPLRSRVNTRPLEGARNVRQV